ncbi:P-loop containing nucleoside triphosphate hydrolase protein [Cunninghamella echinulata]|nr:P-loop containing nucleoside triphosphate hydrolase protein [Cunninghamella echinulata]
MLNSEELRNLMNYSSNIRNVSIIGNMNHGKTILKDNLVVRAGNFSPHSTSQHEKLDNNNDDSNGMTIKSTALSMYYSLPNNNDKYNDKDRGSKNKKDDEKVDLKDENGEKKKSHCFDNIKTNENTMDETKKNQQMENNSFLINLMDTPGHADFSFEVAASLRLSDGALIIVDCVDGVCLQTENLLRQALREFVKPLLVINKIDRALLEYQPKQEVLYKSFDNIIESINRIISTHADESLGDVQVCPSKNNVAFTSGLHGWGFTLQQFARIYSKKFGINEEKILKKLWGDHYFNPSTKKWSKKQRTNDDGKPFERGFNLFVLGPIYKIFSYAFNTPKYKETLCNFFSKINVQFTTNEIEGLEGKILLKVMMKKFLPCDDTLLEMICIHLPSPESAQIYRIPHLYQGPMNDDYARSMKQCNPQGPLMVYVSKIVPFTSSKNDSQFYAFGRIFSGTVRNGVSICMLHPDYQPEVKKKYKTDRSATTTIQQTFLIRGNYMVDAVNGCPAGNIVCFVSKDPFQIGSGTIVTPEPTTTLSSPENHYPLKKIMRICNAPVVQMAVDVKHPSDLPKLVDGLKQFLLANPSPSLEMHIYDTGEHIITGNGELHLDTSFTALEKQFVKVPLKRRGKNQSWISYCETITQSSSITCLAKSPNKWNKIFMRASPLDKDLTMAIENDTIQPNDDTKQRAQKLSDQFRLDQHYAKNIWCFGPGYIGANLLINETKDVRKLDEERDAISYGFQWATQYGPLSEEKVRGCQFNILDAVLHVDSFRRGAGQIIGTSRRVICGSFLTAQPALQEPIYLIDIQCSVLVLNDVYQILHQRRAVILTEIKENKNDNYLDLSSPLSMIIHLKAYLPVNESFELENEFRTLVEGQVSFQLIFDHWNLVDGNPLEPGNKAYDIVRELRIHKGLSKDIPSYDVFCDKL